jgi:hypothetical protein
MLLQVVDMSMNKNCSMLMDNRLVVVVSGNLTYNRLYQALNVTGSIVKAKELSGAIQCGPRVLRKWQVNCRFCVNESLRF